MLPLLFAAILSVNTATAETHKGHLCSQYFSQGVHFATHRSHFLYEQNLNDPNPYFSASFEESRNRFKSNTRKLDLPNQLEHGEFTQIPGAVSESVDYSIIHATEKPKNLVVMISGTHGAEGYAGSALQMKFLESIKKYDLTKTTVLLIHALNPVAMKYMMRMDPVTMINFNRGFPTNEDIYQPETNPDYQLIAPYLIPKGPYSHNWFKRNLNIIKTGASLAYFKFLNPIYRRLIRKKPYSINLRATVGAGQYKYPNGNNFGGKYVHPNIQFFMDLLRDLHQKYQFENQFVLDIHTGLGRVGQLSLIGEAVTPEGLKLQEKVLPGEDVIVYDPDDHENYYPTNGGLTEWVQKVNPRTVPIVFEVGGGISTDGTINGIVVANILLQMLRACFVGCLKAEDIVEIQKIIASWFNPSDREWQDTVVDYYPVIDKLFDNLPQ